MHPELSKKFFDEGVAKIAGNSCLITEQGWLILSSSYPTLTIAMHHRETGKIRVAKFSFDGWNDLPPELSFIDPESGTAIPVSQWPRYQSYWHETWLSPSGIAVTKPFMCMKGIREYHTHHSHIGDLWDNYKDDPDYTLAAIVLKMSQVFQKSNV